MDRTFAFRRAPWKERGGGRQAPLGVAMDRIESLERRIAHLTRAVEDLSDVLARQAGENDRLTRLTQLLAEREAEREAVGDALPLVKVS